MYWKQWLQTLLSLVVLLGLLELLLPSGELAKYSKLVLGLSLMLAVLQPITLLFNEEFLGVDLAWLKETENIPDVHRLAERIQWAAASSVLAEHEEAAAHLEEVLASLEYVQRVRVQLSGGEHAAQSIQVFVDPWEPSVRQEAERLVSTLLRLPAQRISVLPWAE
ncbi:MAG: stage III sporulation protein AF [Limnochordia bacterium]|jgi:stage III sporulation protein AF|nr:stage III sporulation protein AF [Bacillota bacterium]NLL09122.1 hypothetical protein [Bacillota bacterium]HBG10148.1 hypothetical protein [Bacillota bacterium]